MWSFVNTLGSHSLRTKLKTHYSELEYSYNNPLLNLVSSEYVPQVDVQFHIAVVLKNTKCNKHVRVVAKMVPAEHVLNPLSLGTRRSSHKTTSPQIMSEGDAGLLLMLWELSHCARTLEWRE